MKPNRTEIIGLIIAAFACIAGYLALPQIQRWLFPLPPAIQSSALIVTNVSPPTYTPYPTNVPPPTYTPYPTQIFLQPTYTTYPTFTSQPAVVDTPTSGMLSDTPAGTILEVGQSWRTDNLVLTLGDAKLQAQPDWNFCYVSLRFYLENMSAVDRIITVSESEFTINDSLGKKNILHGISSYLYPCPSQIDERPFSQLVKSGERFPDDGYWYVGVSDDITNPSLDYLMVMVNGLSSFKGATWKIKVYH